MTALPPLEEVTRLSPAVIRILGGNPGKFTLQGTNTYLVGTGKARILIDTGEGKPSWTQALETVLQEQDAEIQTVLITHYHGDHIGGVNAVADLCPSSRVYKYLLPEDGGQYLSLDDGAEFRVEGARITPIHCPGHTKDHTVFKLEEEDALFSGDCVLGHGTAVFEDLGVYLENLRKISDFGNGKIYPGHGEVVQNGKAKVLEYIKHRQERENQIIDALRLASVGAEDVAQSKPLTAGQLVKDIYRDVPSSLHPAAEHGVILILNKLQSEKKVENRGDDWFLLEPSKI